MKKNKKDKTNVAVTSIESEFLKSDKFYWILLGVLLLFVVAVRLRLSDFPLERDEGEYAYFGQLILKGIPPYQEAYNMKFPGTYFMYALQMAVFGQTATGIHLGLLLVNCFTIVLLFILIKKLVNNKAAIIGAVCYSLMAISPSVLGFAAHATHYVIIWGIAGTLLLYMAMEKEKMWWFMAAGFLLGMAYIMKQSGVFFVMFGGIALICFYIFKTDRPGWKRILANIVLYGTGGLLPFFLMLLLMRAMGVFDKFWFWTFKYAAAYGSQMKFSDAPELFTYNFNPIFNQYLFLWILAILGIVVLFFHKKLQFNRIFIFLFLVFSFLTTCPGFYFRSHYFVTLLPAIGILIAVFIDFLDTQLELRNYTSLKFITVIVFVGSAFAGFTKEKDYFFSMNTTKMCSQLYYPNPFTESMKIAKYLNANTSETDKIAVLGSEPQIFFYAKRSSATGYIYTYNLMEKHENSLMMQKEMTSEIEKGNPKYVVMVNVPYSWLRHPDSENYIFTWFGEYIPKNYELAGIVDLISPNQAMYLWDADVKGYKTKSQYYVNVYKRKEVIPNP